MPDEKKPDGGKYSRFVGLRLTESEYEKLRGWSESAEMTVSEFIRNAIRNDRINLTYTMQATFPDVTGAVRETGKTMSEISGSLSRIARWLNGGNNAGDELKEAVVRMQTDIGAIRREMDRIESFVNSSFKSFGETGGDGDSETQKQQKSQLQ